MEILRRSLALTGRLIAPFGLVCAVSSSPSILEAWDGRIHKVYLHYFFIAQGWRAYSLAALGFVSMVMAAGTVVTAASSLMDGETVSVIEGFRAAQNRFLPLSGVYFVAVVLLFIGLVAFVLPWLAVASVLFVVLPICVLERRGVASSFKRTLKLTRGVRMRLAGLLTVVLVLYGIEGGYENAVWRLFGWQFALGFEMLGQGILVLFCFVLMRVVHRDLESDANSLAAWGVLVEPHIN